MDPSQCRSIRDHLARRAVAYKGGIATLLLFGIPLLFIGPLVLACIFWFATINLYGYVPWTWFFWGLVITLIPLLFRSPPATPSTSQTRICPVRRRCHRGRWCSPASSPRPATPI
jgi:hypothetical protein